MASPRATLNELLYMSSCMADHIQDFINEAEQSGSNLEDSKQLLIKAKIAYNKACMLVEILSN